MQVKLIRIGNSRAVVIPASWLKPKEKARGKEFKVVEMEINEDRIEIV